MYFIVHCLDRPNAVQDRLAHYDAHKTYLASASVRSVISGPLVADDNKTMIGSLFLLEADTRDEVLAFNAADPFNRAGIWEKVEIHPFLKRVDNR